VGLLTVERRNPGGRLALCLKADLRHGQQHRMRPDLEKGPALELGKRKHPVSEPYPFTNVSAPIRFVGRGRYQFAGEVGYQGQFRRVMLDLACNIFEIIKNWLG